jgi:glycerol-3-phosphate dehydrogenase
VGLRPLVKRHEGDGQSTKGLSREHTILVSRSGLVTVTGGKWTTYRAMAEDVLAQCADASLMPKSNSGVTAHLKLVGAEDSRAAAHPLSQSPGVHSYGAEQEFIQALPGAKTVLCDGLTQAMVRFAARHEYAITVEDMLARRSRLLFLDARMAGALARQVGDILESETGMNPEISEFEHLAKQYLVEIL